MNVNRSETNISAPPKEEEAVIRPSTCPTTASEIQLVSDEQYRISHQLANELVDDEARAKKERIRLMMDLDDDDDDINATAGKLKSTDKGIESKVEDIPSVESSKTTKKNNVLKPLKTPEGTTASKASNATKERERSKSPKSQDSQRMQISISDVSLIAMNVTKSTKETGKVKTAVKKRDNKVEEATSVKSSKATKETNAFKSSKDASSKAPNSRESRGSATPLITTTITKSDKAKSKNKNKGDEEKGKKYVDNANPDEGDVKGIMVPILAIELAHEKAKDVLDNGFHLVIAQALLFYQNRNCELNIDAIDQIKAGNLDVSDKFDCNVAIQLKDLNKELVITLGIAIYGLLAAIIVMLHAIRYKERGDSPIQGLYKLTDRIPIIDSLLEIPISLWIAPFVTIFLWSMFLVCCVGLIQLAIAYNDEMFEDGNMSTFALTAFLVGFDLYRMTGNISQYYVIYKSARADALKKKEIIQHLST